MQNCNKVWVFMYLLPDVKGSGEYDEASRQVPKQRLSARLHPPDITVGRSNCPP
jgi:hypothetical protein